MQGAISEGALVREPLPLSAANTSGVSWGAIFAGAACAAALSFILLILGFGLGLSAISPWSAEGAGAKAIGIAGILWLGFIELASSGLGGYLAGRLRIRWVGVPRDEVHFRDTAHGLIAWAVATVAAATVLASSVTAILSSGIQAGGQVIGGAAGAVASAAGGLAANDEATRYFADALLRADAGTGAAGQAPAPTAPPAAATPSAAADPSGAAIPPAATPVEPVPAQSSIARAPSERADDGVRTEVARVFTNSLAAGSMSAEDRQYLAQAVSRHTGLPPAQAEARVSAVYNRAAAAANDAKNRSLQAAEATREAATYSALWMFVALLGGAFFASLMATIGGRQRDAMPADQV